MVPRLCLFSLILNHLHHPKVQHNHWNRFLEEPVTPREDPHRSFLNHPVQSDENGGGYVHARIGERLLVMCLHRQIDCYFRPN